MKRIGVIAILIFAFFGLADSAYLAQHEAGGTPLICNIQSLSGCNTVASSQYSRILGIPLAEFGVLFYGVLFALAALELAIFNRFLRRTLQIISLIGVISSLYFTSIQIFVISAFCIYCTASAFISLFIFIFAGFIEPIRRGKSNATPPIISPPAPASRLTMPPAS